MMTVELVWPWRRRRGTCLFVYLFVSHGKGDQELLCWFVCCLFVYSHEKDQQLRTLLFYQLPQRRRPITSLFVCLFTSHGEEDEELLRHLGSLVSCHTQSDPLPPLLLKVLELKTLSSSYQPSPQPHSLKPGTMAVLL